MINNENEINVKECYNKYGPMVLRRCRKILKDEDQAYDAMQEVFIKILEKKHNLKNNYLSSLLYRIATNICLNKIRDNKKMFYNCDDEIKKIASYDNIEERTIAKLLLKNIFAREKESTKEIATLYYVDNMTHKEVSNLVGLSISGVRKRLRKLHSLFKEEKK